MSRGVPFILITFLALLSAGCAIPPPAATPAVAMCGFNPELIELPLADDRVGDAALGETGAEPNVMVERISEALTTSGPSRASRQPAILALSGGSLHGAFGAGFLDGWRSTTPDQRLPEFDVVTGISTGSILSTFAFVGDTERGVERYSITNESELLTPIARNRSDGSMSPFELVRVLRRGAVADLSPLRSVLLEEVSPAVMAEVARRHSEVGKYRLRIEHDERKTDRMILECEVEGAGSGELAQKIAATLREVCNLRGEVAFRAVGSLPNDGKVIDDVRKYD